MENETRKVNGNKKLEINVHQFGRNFELIGETNFRSLLGASGEELFNQYSRKSLGEKITVPNWLKESASVELNENLAEIFGITPDNVEFLMPHSWEIANRSVKDLVATMAPTLKKSLEQRNAVGLIDGKDSSAMIPLLALTTDARTRHEAERQWSLAYFSALYEMRNRNLEIPKKARRAQEALDEHYFVPGQTEELKLYSMHGENDNKTLSVCPDYPCETDTEQVRWKEHTFEVRTTNTGELVATSPRTKHTEKAILKLFGKAASNGGEMDIEYVEDAVGIMFIHMGRFDENNKWVPPTEEDMERMMEETVNSLTNNLDVHWYVEDDEVDRDRGQSPHVLLTRRQVFLNGADASKPPIPLEFMYFTPEQYLDYMYHIGEWDESEQKYTGAAHDLFKWSRHRPTMRKLFPGANVQGEPLYDQHELEAAMALQQEKIVENLKNMNTVEPARLPTQQPNLLFTATTI